MKKKVTRFVKITIISSICAALVIFTGIALLFYLYPEESVLNIIKTKSESVLGRKVEIRSLNYSLRGVVLKGVRISDTDESGNILSDNVPLLKAEEAIISYSLISILKKDFNIKTLYFNRLSVRCVFDNEGKSNFQRLFEEIKSKTDGSDEKKSTVKISKIILTDCKLIFLNLPRIVKPLEGEYTVNSTINVEDEKKFLITDTGINLPQGRGNLYPDLVIDVTEKFRLTGKVKLENCSMNWVYNFTKKPLPLPFDKVSGFVDNFEISLPVIKGEAKVVSSLKYSKNIVNAEGGCVVDIENRTVLIKDVKNRINNSSSVLNSLLINYNAGKLSRFNVTNLNYSIADLRSLEHKIPSGFSGGLRGSFSYNNSIINGKIQVSDCSYEDRTEILSGLNTEIEVVNNVIRKQNIPVKIFGSDFNISVATTDNNFKSIYLFIKGDKLDVNNIRLSGGKSSSDFYFPLNLSGKIILGELIYDTFTFRNNQADFAASGKTIKINRLNTKVLSGSLNGSGSINLAGDYPSAQINARFNNMKVHDVKFSEENLNNRLFGFADGIVNLGFMIKEKMTETIRGNATFNISKGKVVNTGIQNGLIIFLAELRYKLKDLEFNKIYGNIDISGKDLMINSFIFNSEDLRLSMNGRINSDLNAKNMSMKLEFNYHFVKDIPRPAIAVFSKYLSGKWYIIPFALNGNITDSKNIKMLKKNQ